MTELSIIGLMSGTSADGIDAALVKTDGLHIKRTEVFGHFAYRDSTKVSIRKTMKNPVAAMDDKQAWIALSQAIADDHAAVVTALRTSYHCDVNLIGFHGQTIYHNSDPHKGHVFGRQTVQLGDAAYLAQTTGINVVHNVRQADMKHGGEGAPLAPIYHAALFASMGIVLPAVLVNIGGVANLTFVTGCDPATLIGFDTGPGNALIDDYMAAYNGANCDFDGTLAAAGNADMEVINKWMGTDFFHKSWPKSLDRQEFSQLLGDIKFITLTPADAAATLTRFTAQSIAYAIGKLPAIPRSVYVAGGGRRNPCLMTHLASLLEMPVITTASAGFAPDMLEAELMAFLAARCYYGMPTSFPGTTGCSKPVVGGEIVSAR